MLHKTKKINSWVLKKQRNPLENFKLNIPKLKEGQFLIKIIYTGFCSSQYGEITGIKGKDKYLPHCLGHEAVGQVVKKNSKKKIFIGDYVVLHWMKSSGEDSRKISYLSEKNEVINSGMITTFSDFSVVSQNRITKINPKPNELIHYALFGCSVSVGLSTVEKLVKPKIKEKILLIGAGAIGLPIIHYCKIKKIKIDVIEVRKRSILLSKKFGCSNTYQNIKNKILIKKLNLSYYDHVIDTSGNSNLLNKLLAIIKPRVNICLVGVAKKGSKIKIDPMKINYGIKIVGSYGGGLIPEKDISRYYLFLKNLNFKFNLYIDKIYKFDEINNLIHDFKNHKIYGKSILKI